MSFSFSGVSSALSDLSETGVSFEGKAINWATAENGMLLWLRFYFFCFIKK